MFLLLAGEQYYPDGAADIQGKYNTFEETLAKIKQDKKDDNEKFKDPNAPYYHSYKYSWYEIFDIDKMEVVDSGSYPKLIT